MTPEQLDRLIKLAGEDESADFVAPSDEVVQRYLLGTATAGERHLVRAALEQSAGFRRELRELTHDVGAAVEAGCSTHYAVHPAHSAPRFPSRHSMSRRVALFLPFALAAGLVAWLLIRQFLPGSMQWTVVERNIEVERLIAMDTRGEVGDKHVFPRAEEAALSEFRNLLNWTPVGLVLRDSLPFAPSLGAADAYRVTLTGNRGQRIGEWSRELSGKDPALWLLMLPSRDLRRIELRQRTTELQLDPAWGVAGCITWTYETASGFHSEHGASFKVLQ